MYYSSDGDDCWKGHQIRAWSSYVSWSLFCGHFVDIQQSFSWNFHIKDGNDFSQFGRTEVNKNPRLCCCWQNHRKSVSAFLRFFDIPLTVSVELKPERVFLNSGFVFHAAELKPTLFADKEYSHVDMSAGVLNFETKIRMKTRGLSC